MATKLKPTARAGGRRKADMSGTADLWEQEGIAADPLPVKPYTNVDAQAFRAFKEACGIGDASLDTRVEKLVLKRKFRCTLQEEAFRDGATVAGWHLIEEFPDAYLTRTMAFAIFAERSGIEGDQAACDKAAIHFNRGFDAYVVLHLRRRMNGESL